MAACQSMQQTLQLQTLLANTATTLNASELIIDTQAQQLRSIQDVALQQTNDTSDLQRVAWEQTNRVEADALRARIDLTFEGKPAGQDLPLVLAPGELKLIFRSPHFAEGASVGPKAPALREAPIIQGSAAGVPVKHRQPDGFDVVETAEIALFRGSLGAMTQPERWRGAKVEAYLRTVVPNPSALAAGLAVDDEEQGGLPTESGDACPNGTRTPLRAKVTLLLRGAPVGAGGGWLCQQTDGDLPRLNARLQFKTIGPAYPYASSPRVPTTPINAPPPRFPTATTSTFHFSQNQIDRCQSKLRRNLQ